MQTTSALPRTAEVSRRALLRTAGLTVRLGAVSALTDVDLEVAPGELVALTGEPGSGKTTLIRVVAGDLSPSAGTIELPGRREPSSSSRADAADGIEVVWQQLELCDNLDVAGNLLLGRERLRLMLSPSRFHSTAAAVLDRLAIPIDDTTRLVGALPGGQRQLLAIAKAISRDPRLLVLDDPTALLGVAEAERIEELIASIRDAGTGVLLATRDVKLMLRLADRIVVLRQGRVVAELDPLTTHPDDVTAVLSGQRVDTSARRQLTRLHGLADRLVSAEPSSSLSLIVSALAAALGADRACIHVAAGSSLACAASLGFDAAELESFARVPFGPAGGPVGRAAERGEAVVDGYLAAAGRYAGGGGMGAWSAPVLGPSGVSGVVTVVRREPGPPHRDELDLLTLYAGYAAGAIERDRLLEQATARNRVLETIREMLQTLAGPVTVGDEGLPVALGALRRGLQADEVGVLSRGEDPSGRWRAYSGPDGTDPTAVSEAVSAGARAALDAGSPNGKARVVATGSSGRVLAVPFNAPGGPTVLVAAWSDASLSEEGTALIEDAAHSLNLAFEREEAGLAHQEAAALRRSRELQRGFLSRLSHELRTPLTAICGYASSLMAPDVTWDSDAQRRFLQTIAAEASRLGRLVDDLLDFSSIEVGAMRLQPDWCELALVVEAAVSCLPPEWSQRVEVSCESGLPPVWADHDRLEQVFVNLLGNAFRHTPPGTVARVGARELSGARDVELTVEDDGGGFPPELAVAPFESARRHRSRSAGAGLGLSIARGIVEAHGGTITLERLAHGTRFRVRLPIEAPAAAGESPAEPRAYA